MRLLSFFYTASALLAAPFSMAVPTVLYSHGDPTDAEQYMLELLNRGRMDPGAEAARYGIDLNEGLAPGTITDTPKQPLAMNASLLAAARAHSQWMLDTDTFSHTGSGGTNPGDRMKAAGYVFSGSWTWGENLGWSGTTGPLEVNPTVASIEKGLFVDEGIPGRGHRTNLENDRFREVGVGVKTGVFTVGGANYNTAMATQDFAKSDALGPFIVGVVYQDRDHDGFYTPGEGISGVTVMPSSGTCYAVTSSSGGFAIPVSATAGTLSVKVSGGNLPGSYTKAVTIEGRNVKVDFNTAVDQPDVPEIRMFNPSFNASGQFGFNISGPSGWSVNIESTANFVRWDLRQTLTLAGTNSFVDSTSNRSGHRYYRVRKP